jgi:hypothetical protein
MRAFIFLSALIIPVSFSMAANGGSVGPGSYDTGFVVHNTAYGNDGIRGSTNDGIGVQGTSANNIGVLGKVDGYGIGVFAEGGDFGTGLAVHGIKGADINGVNALGGDAVGLEVETEVANSAGDAHGIGSTAHGVQGGGNPNYSSYAVEGYADGAYYTYGVLGAALASSYGNESYGVHAEASGGDGASNYGVYATASGGSGSFTPAGYFDGELWYGSLHSTSDRMFKKNIRDYEGGIKTVMALRPRIYEMKTEEFNGKMNLPKGTQIGLVAQEVETVLPEIVSEGVAPAHLTKDERKKHVRKEPTRYKGVNYVELIPVMLKAIQEQQKQIEAQALEIAALKRGK